MSRPLSGRDIKINKSLYLAHSQNMKYMEVSMFFPLLYLHCFNGVFMFTNLAMDIFRENKYA